MKSSKTPKPRVELTMAAAKRILRAIYSEGEIRNGVWCRDRAYNEMRDAIRAAKGGK